MNLFNGVKLAALFALLVAIFGIVGFLFGGVGGMVLGLVFALGTNVFSYYYSDSIVVKMHGAEALPTSDGRYATIHSMVERLASKADIPKPDVYMMDSDTPNAFATGRNPDNAVVCVTSGLLDVMSDDEVEGVLAHEISHIYNRDTLIQTVAGTLSGAISMLAQFLWFSSLDGEARNPIFLIGGMILAPIAASLVQMAISRSREFTADATAADLTQPSYLASALEKIEATVSRTPMRSGARGASHMFIVNPFRGESLAKLFSTHPPTQERVERLRRMG